MAVRCCAVAFSGILAAEVLGNADAFIAVLLALGKCVGGALMLSKELVLELPVPCNCIRGSQLSDNDGEVILDDVPSGGGMREVAPRGGSIVLLLADEVCAWEEATAWREGGGVRSGNTAPDLVCILTSELMQRGADPHDKKKIFNAT